MERLTIAPRPDFGRKLERIGLSFHGWDHYWKEDVYYRFTSAQVDEIEAATGELHALCIETLERVLRQGRIGELGIPKPFWNAVEQSFRQRDFSVYGRFDLACDGMSPPKMLEYNADTPTSLLESAVAQWYWLEEVFPHADQFNALHEKLVARWQQLPGTTPVHFASLRDNEEDWVCTTYLMETATQAGKQVQRLDVEALGWHDQRRTFVDTEGLAITQLFKLYPWEWMLAEEFGAHISESGVQFIEPLWKAMLSSKALLPLLWEYFPGHPNLLPAYRSPERLRSYARKPIFSREGANVQLVSQGKIVAEGGGPYGAEGCIYQALHALPCMGGRYPVIGSWVVGAEPAGMCVREDTSPITTNMSSFVPHCFE